MRKNQKKNKIPPKKNKNEINAKKKFFYLFWEKR